MDAIANVLRVSKQVLKSVMTLGDGWIQRVANNPCAELQGKVDNMRCNLKKNKNLREAYRRIQSQQPETSLQGEEELCG